MGALEVVAPLKGLLENVSDAKIRELGVAVLRDWRRQHRDKLEFSLSVLYGIADRLAEGKRIEGNLEEACSHAFRNSGDFPWMAGAVDFSWWVVRAGFAIPLGAELRTVATFYRLTRSGERFLDSNDDHPLIPGATKRTADRCVGLPDDVANLLRQSRECMEHGLLRPAIIILGVGYEVAIEEIVASMVIRGLLPPSAEGEVNSRKIDRVRAQIDVVLQGASRDDREAVRRAYDFAHDLRRRRNDAAHTAPTYGFDDSAETEELLVSSLRQLPSLWRMYA